MDQRKTGTLIAQRRMELGLTQKELAGRLHLSDRTVSKWERGAGFPDVSLVEPLADALGLSVLELLHGERVPLPAPEAQEESPAAERAARETLRAVLPQLRRQMGLFRRLAAIVLAGAAVLLALLFLDPVTYWVMDRQTEEPAKVVERVPGVLITTGEYDLLRDMAADPRIGGRRNASDQGVDLTEEELEPYLADLGEPLYCTGSVIGESLILDYVPDANTRCIVTYSFSGGTVLKVVCPFASPIYENGEYQPRPARVIAENFDNERFSLYRNRRDLFGALGDESRSWWNK